MALVKVDEKGRILLPREVRKVWKLKPKQPLVVRRRGEELVISRVDKIVFRNDPLLRDIVIHPLRSKVKITKSLLEKLEEEQWSS